MFLQEHASPCPSSRVNLPIWASWHWGRNYLPENLHIVWNKFHITSATLQKAKFADQNKGTAIILSLGLLLCKCWWAEEAEADANNMPSFLSLPLLEVEQAQQVINVINDIISKSQDIEALVAEEGQQGSQVVDVEDRKRKEMLERREEAERSKKDEEARKELELKRNEEEEARRRENERRKAGDQEGELLQQETAMVGKKGKEKEKEGWRGQKDWLKDKPSPSFSSNYSTRSTSCKQADSPAKNQQFSKWVTKPSKRHWGSDYA